MDTVVAVKPEPMWLVEDEEMLPRMKTVPVPITFPCVKKYIIMRNINHVNVKNETVSSADVCEEGNRILKSDIDIEEKSLLEDRSECNYSAEEMDSEVTVKPESVWLVEDEEMSQAHVEDEGIMAAVDFDEVKAELKPEIDIEENCILGDTSELIQSCKVAGDTNVLENEGIIISSTDKFQAVEGYMLEYEEQVTIKLDKKRERKFSTKKRSQKVHNSISESAVSSKTQFKCDICGRCVKTYSNIVRHINTHTLRKPFKCEVCYKCFTESGSLERHMRTHSGNKPFKCKECSNCFTRSENLKAHMNLHTENNPFKCNECSKCFTSSRYLKVHLSCHSGENPFKCKECSKGFFSSSNLKVHMRCHTGEKPFKCKECSRSFSHSSHLKRHVRIHSENKPFKCNECLKCFIEPWCFTRHMSMHTREKAWKN